MEKRETCSKIVEYCHEVLCVLHTTGSRGEYLLNEHDASCERECIALSRTSRARVLAWPVNGRVNMLTESTTASGSGRVYERMVLPL